MTYPGGKNGSGIYQKLINLMPPHETYIEPFLGGGAVLRLKRPAARSIGVDLDPEVVQWWNGKLATRDTNGDSAGDIPMCRPAVARSRIGARAGFDDGGHRRPTLEWSMPPGPTSVIQADGIQFLRDYPFTGGELIYCDPPYLLSSRTSCDRDYYSQEMTDVQHRELLRILRGLKCRVMLSGYSSNLYDLHLTGWNSISYSAPTRRGLREEWCWFNYPRPVELHDYRFLGSDYREREKLKKQQRRWQAKLQAMPVPQRQALLAAIADIA